jgi:DNA invertase Pin-like site-specific DNA recombinase
MNMTKVICYYRVSTREQGNSGLGLAAQRKLCREFAAMRPGWELHHLEHDEASGKSTNGRHNLAIALDMMDRHEADVLLAAKLDRLSRSVQDFATILERARRGRWALAVADLNLDMSTPMGEFAAYVMVSVAQLERRLISERTKAALAEIPRDTTHLDAFGNVKGPPGGPIQIDAETSTLVGYMRSQGKSFRAICAELTAMGKPTPRGGPWQVSTIQRILARS